MGKFEQYEENWFDSFWECFKMDFGNFKMDFETLNNTTLDVILFIDLKFTDRNKYWLN